MVRKIRWKLNIKGFFFYNYKAGGGLHVFKYFNYSIPPLTWIVLGNGIFTNILNFSSHLNYSVYSNHGCTNIFFNLVSLKISWLLFKYLFCHNKFFSGYLHCAHGFLRDKTLHTARIEMIFVLLVTTRRWFGLQHIKSDVA